MAKNKNKEYLLKLPKWFEKFFNESSFSYIQITPSGGNIQSRAVGFFALHYFFKENPCIPVSEHEAFKRKVKRCLEKRLRPISLEYALEELNLSEKKEKKEKVGK